MCLSKKSLLPRITIKPVKVYKVFYSFNGNLFTPFIQYKVINKTIKAKKFDIPEIFWEDRITWCGVHAFRNLVTAERAARSWITRAVDSKLCPFVVCECVIPPFTLYWNGKEGDIAARRINIKKEILNDL